MFRPRWTMTSLERDRLDAQFADLLASRREIAAMDSIQRSCCVRELCEVAIELRRTGRIEGANMVASLMATVVMLAQAMTFHSVIALVAAMLTPIGALRALHHYTLARDTYFGTLRQIRETDQPPEPALSRFDDR